ncbi:hypothetical protein [Lignipirellula cremea]|nr:hypothetical protein [Lignipirellula cremea]
MVTLIVLLLGIPAIGSVVVGVYLLSDRAGKINEAQQAEQARETQAKQYATELLASRGYMPARNADVKDFGAQVEVVGQTSSQRDGVGHSFRCSFVLSVQGKGRISWSPISLSIDGEEIYRN